MRNDRKKSHKKHKTMSSSSMRFEDSRYICEHHERRKRRLSFALTYSLIYSCRFRIEVSAKIFGSKNFPLFLNCVIVIVELLDGFFSEDEDGGRGGERN